MLKNIILLTAVKESGKTTTFNSIVNNSHILGLRPDEVVEMMLAKKLKDVVAHVSDLPRELMDDARVLLPGEEIPKEYSHFLDDSKRPDYKIPVREIPFKEPYFLTLNVIQRITSQFGFEEEPKNTIKHLNKQIPNVRVFLQYVGTELLRDYDEEVHCNAAIRVMKENPQGKLFIVTDGRFHNEFDFFAEKAFTTAIIRDEKIEASKARIERGEEHKSEIYVPELIERCEFKIDNNGDLENLDNNVRSFLGEISRYQSRTKRAA